MGDGQILNKIFVDCSKDLENPACKHYLELESSLFGALLVDYVGFRVTISQNISMINLNSGGLNVR